MHLSVTALQDSPCCGHVAATGILDNEHTAGTTALPVCTGWLPMQCIVAGPNLHRNNQKQTQQLTTTLKEKDICMLHQHAAKYIIGAEMCGVGGPISDASTGRANAL
jgi:hypothetical protein